LSKFAAKPLKFWGLAVAAAGSLGAPMVICDSAQQFASLVPKDEPVYVAFEFLVVKESEGCNCDDIVKKVYWAFIENRAGLIIYEDWYSKDGFSVEKYNAESITFYQSNEGWIIAAVLIFAFVGGIFAVEISYKILEKYEAL